MLVLIAYFAVVTIVSYAIAMWLARRSIAELRRHAPSMSNKARSLQSQFARALLAQVIHFSIKLFWKIHGILNIP
jgi:hypothetical protein